MTENGPFVVCCYAVCKTSCWFGINSSDSLIYPGHCHILLSLLVQTNGV